MPRDTNYSSIYDDLSRDGSRRCYGTKTSTFNSNIIVDGHVFHLGSRYSLPKMIGSGAYGQVISAYDSLLQRKVAIKKIKLPSINAVEAKLFYSRSLREICILTPLKHDNIVQVLDCYTPAATVEHMREIYIVTNLMRLDLHQLIKMNNQRPIDKRIITSSHVPHFLYQILRALKFIHSAKVLHRDLKPSNIFVDLDGHVRIGDFGLARVPEEEANTPMTGYVCTRWYRAPELMLCDGTYNSAIDMWSVGCILSELIFGQPLFPGRHYFDQLRLIVERRCGSLGFLPHEHRIAYPTITDKSLNALHRILGQCTNYHPKPFLPSDSIVPNIDAAAFDLLEGLLLMDPHKRLTADDALHSSLFNNYRKDAGGEPSSEEAFQLDLSPYQLPDIRAMLFQKVQLVHQQLHEKALILNEQATMAASTYAEKMDCY
ncbi:unnamed protein product [Rotaria magnacalcarata]|uniref:Protein kinase domain-containing protein n=5 Tax=Rotaria magnacalcarata TaxID=392030 RepID=A0A816LQ41_9BILA|nr:unnamed protein product [Rotaria magnacalcarata]CAF1640322.1 unnamed protein product [Rotaria magnacalcarata]CAF1965829.1 unnamed protein product [Rotaria magnacalcarata]CAF2074965.1 unnamed protein product [Rotaria magnacalcarata]CAF2121393.1 unnamed protein product [Rotaria magnacalcarata]